MRTEFRTPVVLSASTLNGDRVQNPAGEDLGKIEELMIDLDSGRVAYAVLSFGGFLSMGNNLFAIPWEALKVDTVNKIIILNVNKEMLESAPGFDKDHWPDTSEHAWLTDVYKYYGYDPYWS
jgi:sporulation protein YlmC with PRC-barrel domain